MNLPRSFALALFLLALLASHAAADEFQPPPEFAGQYGNFRSPLKFYDGTPVKTPADWARRREEIRQRWFEIMGPWPPLIESPKLEILSTEEREGFQQH